MTTIKFSILIAIALLNVLIMLMNIRFVMRKTKLASLIEEKQRLCFSIWFFSLFISGSVIIYKILFKLFEAIDYVYKLTNSKIFLEIAKTTSLYVGLSIAWFYVIYLMSRFLLLLMVGKRDLTKELEAGSFQYFLINGVVLFGLTFSTLSLFDILLGIFMPSVEIPFYH